MPSVPCPFIGKQPPHSFSSPYPNRRTGSDPCDRCLAFLPRKRVKKEKWTFEISERPQFWLSGGGGKITRLSPSFLLFFPPKTVRQSRCINREGAPICHFCLGTKWGCNAFNPGGKLPKCPPICCHFLPKNCTDSCAVCSCLTHGIIRSEIHSCRDKCLILRAWEKYRQQNLIFLGGGE